MSTYALLKPIHVFAVIAWLESALNTTLLYLALLLSVVGGMVVKPSI